MDLNNKYETLVQNTLSKLEEHVDSELERCKDIETLRKERLKEMKAEAEKLKIWNANDHGTYQEVYEKQFFEITKRSSRVVVHFYTTSSIACTVFDHHLLKLAKQHLETRFIKINSEKAPFLSERLRINKFPALVFVKNNQVQGKRIGLEELGNTLEFRTELLEWRLAHHDIIKYDGDLTTRPDYQQNQNKLFHLGHKSSIRGKDNADDSDDSEFYD